MRIVVAMSGGVDSSTAAGLLVEQGHEVIGLAMKTHADSSCSSRACCTPDDMRDARRVADHLRIPFYVLNYEELFLREVILPFAQAYASGETPNPCIECNDKVKFRPLLKRARLLGAQGLATGHYERIDGPVGARRLLRGVDRHKDQSYFLYRLTQDQLAMLSFPLGGMHKEEVRAEARRLGLPVAEKRESQEILSGGEDLVEAP
ncbi:MAG: tRNA 2-thiouridine(34) synthase MnmA, partial [Myxococcota bacterium]